MTRKCAQVFLLVSDIEQSARFYRSNLGLPVKRRGSRNVVFETGACELMLQEDFDEKTLSRFGLSSPGERRGRGGIIVLEVENLDEAYRAAKRDEEAILCEPQEVDWGREMFLVKDPDGYVLELSRPIST